MISFILRFYYFCTKLSRSNQQESCNESKYNSEATSWYKVTRLVKLSNIMSRKSSKSRLSPNMIKQRLHHTSSISFLSEMKELLLKTIFMRNNRDIT